MTANALERPERLLRVQEGAQMLGISKSFFWQRVRSGEIPKPVKLGRLSRWRLSDIEAVIEEAARASTA